MMFDIDYLLIPPLKKQFEGISEYSKKVDFLINLINYEVYFEKYSGDIEKSWAAENGERYIAEDYSFILGEKDFLTEYAEKTGDIKKVIGLINALCNDIDADKAIAQARNEITVIAEIDDFDFTDNDEKIGQKKENEKTRLDVLLKFKPKK